MTQFDIIVLVLLGISAAVGFMRGAVREIAALLALVVAAGLAVFGLPVFGPIFRGFIHPVWLGTLASIVIVIGAYWSIRADVQLLSWRMSQVESRLEQLMNRTQQSRNNPNPEP